MKDWATDHPKAKLMARKRAVILDAARAMFLELGYEGTTMEAIAAEAGVSIMTLYRHAENKEDLFAAVISGACDPSDEAEQAAIVEAMKKPLHDILVMMGAMFQERLSSPGTTALLRAVMAETSRFPQLAETAYRSLVGFNEQVVDGILAEKSESARLGSAARRKISAAFVDRLFGADLLRVLLGMGGASPAEQRRRAERAAEETLAEIETTRRKAAS